MLVVSFATAGYFALNGIYVLVEFLQAIVKYVHVGYLPRIGSYAPGVLHNTTWRYIVQAKTIHTQPTHTAHVLLLLELANDEDNVMCCACLTGTSNRQPPKT